jgi:hypothetical protein
MIPKIMFIINLKSSPHISERQSVAVTIGDFHVYVFTHTFVSQEALISHQWPNFKVLPSPGLSGYVMQMMSLASNNSGTSLTWKWLML